jgi:hypothetical protein
MSCLGFLRDNILNASDMAARISLDKVAPDDHALLGGGLPKFAEYSIMH